MLRAVFQAVVPRAGPCSALHPANSVSGGSCWFSAAAAAAAGGDDSEKLQAAARGAVDAMCRAADDGVSRFTVGVRGQRFEWPADQLLAHTVARACR